MQILVDFALKKIEINEEVKYFFKIESGVINLINVEVEFRQVKNNNSRY